MPRDWSMLMRTIDRPTAQRDRLMAQIRRQRVTLLLYYLTDAVWLSVLTGLVCLFVIVTLSLLLVRRRTRRSCRSGVVDKSTQRNAHAGTVYHTISLSVAYSGI